MCIPQYHMKRSCSLPRIFQQHALKHILVVSCMNFQSHHIKLDINETFQGVVILIPEKHKTHLEPESKPFFYFPNLTIHGFFYLGNWANHSLL